MLLSTRRVMLGWHRTGYFQLNWRVFCVFHSQWVYTLGCFTLYFLDKNLCYANPATWPAYRQVCWGDIPYESTQSLCNIMNIIHPLTNNAAKCSLNVVHATHVHHVHGESVQDSQPFRTQDSRFRGVRHVGPLWPLSVFTNDESPLTSAMVILQWCCRDS